MINPWLEIPAGDYESHMKAVGQARILRKLTGKALRQYAPRTFALIGCAMGNGLEYVDNAVTPYVYALDINPDYVATTKARFQSCLTHLYPICCDLMKSDISGIRNIDLAFCGLMLEYVDSRIVIPKIAETLSKKGKLVLVIQKNDETTFVTKSPYSSLEKLSGFAIELDSDEIDQICQANGLMKIRSEKISVGTGKSFEVMDYKR